MFCVTFDRGVLTWRHFRGALLKEGLFIAVTLAKGRFLGGEQPYKQVQNERSQISSSPWYSRHRIRLSFWILKRRNMKKKITLKIIKRGYAIV